MFGAWVTANMSKHISRPIVHLTVPITLNASQLAMDDERLKNPPGKGQKDYFDEQLERIRDIRSWARPPGRPWPAEHHFARGETHWMLLLPPLVTAALVIWAGVFADSPFSPLAWVKLIAEREYGP